MHLKTRRDGDTVEAELAGNWRGGDLPAIDAEIEGISLSDAGTLRVTVPKAWKWTWRAPGGCASG
jgi:hypothetical protein